MGVSIKDRVALVTGANRGIGKAIVDSFIKAGAKKVYLAVRNPASAAALTEQYGDKVVAIAADLSDADSIKALAGQAGDVEIVVNNGGVLIPANPLSDNAETALDREMQVNVYGLIRMAQAFAPILEGKQNTAFVQLNSVASMLNFTDFSTYSASKAAAFSITQGLRDTFTEKGIHVLSVHPGPISTDMADTAGLGDMGEPVSVVSDGIVSALEAGDFLLFPDSLAKNIQAAWQSYADTVILGDLFAEDPASATG